MPPFEVSRIGVQPGQRFGLGSGCAVHVVEQLWVCRSSCSLAEVSSSPSCPDIVCFFPLPANEASCFCLCDVANVSSLTNNTHTFEAASVIKSRLVAHVVWVGFSF